MSQTNTINLDDCWLYGGYKMPLGYGVINITGEPRGATALVHRVMYEALVAPIPTGYFLDHLCRVPACINPVHLEPVLPRENTKRGLRGVLGTKCKHGHSYTDKTVWYRKRTFQTRDGTIKEYIERYCLTCQKIMDKR